MSSFTPQLFGRNIIDRRPDKTCAEASGELSAAGRRRILSVPGNPAFLCDWSRAVFIHYEVDAATLQRDVPFPLDLHEGRAYLSLVAFTMRDMRPCFGGRLAAVAFRPIATHNFLNFRAYVKVGDETGIYFLAEWLPNRLSVLLGPPIFGLPYRHGLLEYHHRHETGELRGLVANRDNSLQLEYSAAINPAGTFSACDAGSRDEFLLERYTAFTARGSRRRKFRIWHPPWPQTPVDIRMVSDGLLRKSWPWFEDTRLLGAHYSPGFTDVWMGRPQQLFD